MKNLLIYKLLLAAFICILFGADSSNASVESAVLEYNRGIVSCRSESVSLFKLLEKLADAGNIQIYIASRLQDYAVPVDFKEIPVQEVISTLLRGYSFAVVYTEASETINRVYLYEKGNKGTGNRNKTDSIGSEYRKIAAIDKGSSFGVDIPEKYHKNEDKNIHTDSRQISKDSRGDDTRFNSITGNGYVGSISGKRFYFSSSGQDVDLQGQSADTGLIDADSERDTDLPVLSVSQDTYNDLDPVEKRKSRLEFKIGELEADIESGRADQFYDSWTQRKDPRYVYNHWDDLERCKKALAELENP